MLNHYASKEGFALEPRLRRDLARRPRKTSSRYISRLMAELDEIDYALRNKWDKIDPAERHMLHGLMIGAPPPKLSLLNRANLLLDSLRMGNAFLWHRDEVYRYFARSDRVRELLQEKVGSDISAETMSSPEEVAAIERGREDARAGLTVELVEN